MTFFQLKVLLRAWVGAGIPSISRRSHRIGAVFTQAIHRFVHRKPVRDLAQLAAESGSAGHHRHAVTRITTITTITTITGHRIGDGKVPFSPGGRVVTGWLRPATQWSSGGGPDRSGGLPSGMTGYHRRFAVTFAVGCY